MIGLLFPVFFIFSTANRDHNVPDTNTQQYIRSTIMIGEEIASTSNQSSSSRRKPSLSNQKKSGSSSSSSPIMSPSYNQNNKQYRTNIPRAVDLVESKYLKFVFKFPFEISRPTQDTLLTSLALFFLFLSLSLSISLALSLYLLIFHLTQKKKIKKTHNFRRFKTFI